MTPTELLETILTNTFTQTDFTHRLTLLKEFLEFEFFKPQKNRNLLYLLNEFIEQKKESRDELNALSSWGYDFFNTFNKANFYFLLQKIEADSRAIPVATLYLPFVPPVYEIPKLGRWFRTKINPATMLDLKLDHSLIGGAAVVWKGSYHDYSLRYYLQKNKEMIKNVIENYLGEAPQTKVKA